MRSLTIRLLFALASLHVCNVYAAFTIGDRVQANGLVWVRQTPGGAYVGDQASGVQGTILDGPIVAKIGGVGNNYNWYKIDWPSPPDGWVADVGLVVVPPNKPTAQTKTATSIADTSATLNGYINPNGQGTTAYFEYGTTTGYGNTTPQGNFGTTPQDLAYPISGLTPGTIYHFRIVAHNSGGTSYGSDSTLTTLAQAPTAQTKAATSIADTSATLNGYINPNGQGTTAYFEYGTTTGYGSTTPQGNFGTTP